MKIIKGKEWTFSGLTTDNRFVFKSNEYDEIILLRNVKYINRDGDIVLILKSDRNDYHVTFSRPTIRKFSSSEIFGRLDHEFKRLINKEDKPRRTTGSSL